LLDLSEDRGPVQAVEIERLAERVTAAAAEVDAERGEDAHGVRVALDEVADQGVGNCE
jgi:hypothetical protein